MGFWFEKILPTLLQSQTKTEKYELIFYSLQNWCTWIYWFTHQTRNNLISMNFTVWHSNSHDNLCKIFITNSWSFLKLGLIEPLLVACLWKSLSFNPHHFNVFTLLVNSRHEKSALVKLPLKDELLCHLEPTHIWINLLQFNSFFVTFSCFVERNALKDNKGLIDHTLISVVSCCHIYCLQL